jgi:hypothetical protein
MERWSDGELDFKSVSDGDVPVIYNTMLLYTHRCATILLEWRSHPIRLILVVYSSTKADDELCELERRLNWKSLRAIDFGQPPDNPQRPVGL